MVRTLDGRAQMTDEQGPIDFLLGTWRGEGSGEYPTMDPFTYREEIVFARAGGPSLRYVQRAWDTQTGAQLHTETGLWLAAGGVLVATFSLPAVAEVSEGSVRGASILMKSIAISRSAVGPPLAATRRSYRLDEASLLYDIEMATVEVKITRHVWGRLARVGAP